MAQLIAPPTYTPFENEEEQIQKLKEWGLLSEKASKSKTFIYKNNGVHTVCSIVGYVDKMTAVLALDDKQHCIHPSYLKEMQTASFGQRQATAAEDEGSDTEDAAAAVIAQAVEAESSEQPIESATATVAAASAIEEAPAESTAAKSEEKPAAKKAKKEKAPKLELPEEKVKMRATVKEFTTVPNNFSDTDDEVVIYEEVSIEEPALELGAAWSSHSNTLKKLELAVGDTITFECKIVAKKLTKHPVAYKINNPGKITKEES
ncbi:hypothetical protein [Paenibacillus sp. CF384]|uniref:hypothetical protein n=1 Tax=Paenibacillus sp. CF384 TaxID=1884382 RepID=UPI0008981377|nr:hypothetical protein [Paenibacillus sp. CF384]SDW56729.1 hypothetical protein SAMN05518855_1003119 [Paenibacillus sp. CF384]